MPHPRLAKLTCPRSDGLLKRARLFDALDEARKRPVTWIVGPPGAGKTSLLSTYLETRKLPALWYQVDASDADPAAFFHYLGIAASDLLGKKAKPLPVFTADFAANLAGFARHYFRELFNQLPDGCAVVLDNYQDVSDGDSFHASIREAIEQLPSGMHVVGISRAEPPAEFTRIRAAQKVAFIGWDELKLTFEEAKSIASKQHSQSDEAVRSIHVQTDGWAAGLVLMLERVRQTGQVRHVLSSDNLETVFDYFAEELFNTEPQATKRMLIRMSYLPQLNADTAQVITGNPQAGKLLADLSKRNLFTDKRYGEQTSYQFHALFRTFLQEKARQELGSSEYQSIASSAAALLQTIGEVEQAFVLHVSIGAWEPAARLVVKEAERLIRQGRRQTLRQWITALPMDRVEEDASLLYCLGICTLGVNHEKSRDILTKAFERSVELRDKAGEVMAAGAVAESHFTMRLGWAGLDQWIDRLTILLLTEDLDLKQEIRVRATITLGRCMFYRRPQDIQLPKLIGILLEYVGGDVPANDRVAAGAVAIGYHSIRGEDRVCEYCIAEIEPLLEDADVSPASRAFLYFWWINHAIGQGDIEAVRILVSRAQQVSDELNLSPMSLEFVRMGTSADLLQGNYGTARKTLEQHVAPFLGTARPAARLFYDMHIAVCDLASGDVASARHRIEEALNLGRTNGYLLAELSALSLAAIVCAEQRDHQNASKYLQELRDQLEGWDNAWYASFARACAAFVMLRRGDSQTALLELQASLPTLRDHRYVWFPTISAFILPHIVAFALSRDLGTHWLPDLIRRRGLRCPELHLESWSWQVKLRSFPTFKVELENGESDNPGKAQHKLLELLKAIVALGKDGVSTQELSDALWPDAEGDIAQNTLQVSLYRLRKLLGIDDVILLHDGKLTINRHVCWVDAWALEDKTERLKALAKDSAELEVLAKSGLALYNGHFLSKEKEQPWMLAARDKLRRLWLGTVRSLGQVYEAKNDWILAVELYQKALDIDPIAEEIYRRVMICLNQTGNRAETINAYSRCKEQLTTLLGVPPSAETERLYQSLRSPSA